MRADLRAAVGAELGAALTGVRALGGGSMSEAWAVELADGRRVFVKTNEAAPADMFAVEVRGLAFLRAGLAGVEGVGVPAVVGVGARFLALELLEPGPPCLGFDELLGRGLAELHRSGAGLGRFGLDHDNYIGSEPQRNDWRDDWPSFYRDCRLQPMVARVADRGLLSPQLGRRFEAVCAGLDELCGDLEPPARLHGDLWAGNLHRDRQGRPMLIDPAVYLGHREVDLAMMALFGGFSPRTLAAYAEVWPLSPGWERRVDLYQLYPLLVHVALFGRGYVGALESALARLA